MLINSNCCCLGIGEEVHVLKEDCPIQRQEGQRKYISRGVPVEDCTCIYVSAFPNEEGVLKCTHYKGTQIDKKLNKYVVNCTYKP